MNAARAWLIACRPATLTAAVVPVLVGTAVAHARGGARALPAFAALVGAVLIQIAANFANDVFDHEKGADTEERLGPTRVTQAGLLTARAVRVGIVVAFALALVPGAYLASVGGVPIVAVGLASMACGVTYTAGPYPLGYHGLGDVFVFAFFGLAAVLGTAFVESGFVPPLAWLAAVPVGALATAVLVVNNVRDRATDVVAGKRTLAVRFGRKAALGEYVALVAVAYAASLAVAWTERSPWPLLPLASAPIAVHLVRRVLTDEGKSLNRSLAGTAKLLLVFGALLALGLVLAKETRT